MDALLLKTVLFLAVCKLAVTNGQMYNATVELKKRLLEGYDRSERPVINATHPVSTNLTFELGAIRAIDEVTGKISVSGSFIISWVDEKLTWEPWADGSYTNYVSYRSSDIWYPNLILWAPYSEIKDIGQDWMLLRVLFNGVTYFGPSVVLESICVIDITYYPFDVQNCTLSFFSQYTGIEVELHPNDEEAQKNLYTENGEWRLESTRIWREEGSSYKSDFIHINLIMKRRPTFLIVNILLPIIFMTVINLFVFVLPAESGERVSFSVTVLLALAVFLTLIGDNLPKTSQPMSMLGYYLLAIMIQSVLITISAILNLKLYFIRGSVPKCLRPLAHLCRSSRTEIVANQISQTKIKEDGNETRKSNEGPETDTKEDSGDACQEMSKCIDRVCLVVFVGVTIVMNLIFLAILANDR